jgi:hypothetical protein
VKRNSFFSYLLIPFLISGSVLAQNSSSKGFEKIKSLAGKWEGKGHDNQMTSVSYEIISGGNAVMESLNEGEDDNMITIYHLDGDKLIMTHYCSSGNQPRMKAEMMDDNSINFTFAEATNLAKTSDGHMHKLSFNFVDNNNFTQTWTWSEDGKEMPATFNWTRKN